MGHFESYAEGQIDIHAKDRFQRVVEEALRQTPPSGILIDLSTVDSIDAAGLE